MHIFYVFYKALTFNTLKLTTYYRTQKNDDFRSKIGYFELHYTLIYR